MSPTKVPNERLLEAGLKLMAQNGKPLERAEVKGRAMLYRSPNGRSIRVRTCNDHVLVAVADAPDTNAKLNIEGTDDILIVMPETPRSSGPVVGYLIPTPVVVEAVRSAHRSWLESNPSTKGENRTWNIWFDDDAPAKANGFAQKWSSYRLQGSATTDALSKSVAEVQQVPVGSLGEVIADAKRRIAAVAGIPETAVKITLDLT
jgi:hypothetical protein